MPSSPRPKDNEELDRRPMSDDENQADSRSNRKSRSRRKSSSRDKERKHKRQRKHESKDRRRRKRRRHYSSSSSSCRTEDTSSSSESDDSSSYHRRRDRKRKKQHRHKKRKKRSSSKRRRRERKDSSEEERSVSSAAENEKSNEIKKLDSMHSQSKVPAEETPKEADPPKRSRAMMVPMSKAEYDKQQSQVRQVYDPESGRYRMVRGTGEIIESIVSRADHQRINQQATRGDGASFSRSTFSAVAAKRGYHR